MIYDFLTLYQNMGRKAHIMNEYFHGSNLSIFIHWLRSWHHAVQKYFSLFDGLSIEDNMVIWMKLTKYYILLFCKNFTINRLINQILVS